MKRVPPVSRIVRRLLMWDSFAKPFPPLFVGGRGYGRCLCA